MNAPLHTVRWIAAMANLILTDEGGQDLVEYALLLGFISVVAFVIILLVGPSLQSAFQVVVSALASLSPAAVGGGTGHGVS